MGASRFWWGSFGSEFFIHLGSFRNFYFSFNIIAAFFAFNGMASRKIVTSAYNMAIVVLTHHSSGTLDLP